MGSSVCLGNGALEASLESRLGTSGRARGLEMKSRSGVRVAASPGKHGGGGGRLPPQPAQAGRWLGKAEHRQL